jgi:pimeloyl-ACP methyl ester carboxylesterase
MGPAAVGTTVQTVTTDGTTIAYETHGDAERPAVAFVGDAGFGPWTWGWQAPSLAGPYRTLVTALRGTDGSGSDGPYDVDRFAADLEAVLADAGVRRVHLVGAGLGGAIALRYAREYARARSLVSIGAATSGDLVDGAALAALHPTDRSQLRESLSKAFSDRFLSASTLVEDVLQWRRDEDASGDALDGHLAALRGFETGPLYEIGLPALVLHGIDDPIVSVAAGRDLAEDLPRARFEAVEGRRCCYVEHAAAVTDAIDGFVDDVRSDYRE